MKSEEKTLLNQCLWAIQSHNLQEVEKLLLQFQDINIKDDNGFTFLHYASQEYAVDVAELLLKKGAEINSKNEFGNTPLFVAVANSRGRGDMIKLLLKYGGDPEIKNNFGISPITLARTIANYNVISFFEKNP